MDRKNRISGLVLINTSVIGLIIKNMVLEFNITQIVINIKEDGLLISVMVKEHFG
jgi:hypothetical protein